MTSILNHWPAEVRRKRNLLPELELFVEVDEIELRGAMNALKRVFQEEARDQIR